MRKLPVVPIFAALACIAGSGDAGSAAFIEHCVKQSPAHAVALIELYTSDGCANCPPADRWLSGMGDRGFGLDKVVPLTLHVDYWDRYGWKDRFADPQFTSRQHLLADLTAGGLLYTPGMFMNLHASRDWESETWFKQSVQEITARPAPADIRLEITIAPPAQLVVKADFELKPDAADREPQGFVALFENDVVSEVQSGENRGASLHYDYVVRQWIGPIELNKGKAVVEKTLSVDAGWNPHNLGIAAFIQDFGRMEVLQATALSACR